MRVGARMGMSGCIILMGGIGGLGMRLRGRRGLIREMRGGIRMGCSGVVLWFLVESFYKGKCKGLK